MSDAGDLGSLLRESVRALRRIWLIVLLSGVFLVAAAVPVLGFYSLLSAELADSDAARVILRGDPRVSAMTLQDLFAIGDLDKRITPVIFGGVALFVLANLFFAGGIARWIDQRSRAGDFLSSCARTFFRNVALLLLFVVTFAFAAMICGALFALTSAMLEGEPPNSIPGSVVRISLMLIAVWLFAIWSMALDVARGIVARVDRAPASTAWSASLRLMFRRPFLPLILGAIWFAWATLLSIAWGMVEWSITDDRSMGLLLLVLVLAGYALTRSAVRIAAWGAAIAFLESALAVRPIVIPVAQPVEVTPAMLPVWWEDDDAYDEE